MKIMNYFLKISLASLLAVAMMTLSSSNAMHQQMMPAGFSFQMPAFFTFQIDPKPMQITVDSHAIKLTVMGGLLVVGLYGIFQLLNAQTGPRYQSAGLATAAIAAGICCVKYSDTILG
jgi:hypothetical protein